jgi:hypothetical protein
MLPLGVVSLCYYLIEWFAEIYEDKRQKRNIENERGEIITCDADESNGEDG